MSERRSIEQSLAYRRTSRESGDTPAVRAYELESNIGNEPERSNESKKVCQKPHIDIHCYRTRPADPDNCCAKWTIDALVSAEIIPDDSRKYIEVTFRETKCDHYSGKFR
jgi:hypothetical protein